MSSISFSPDVPRNPPESMATHAELRLALNPNFAWTLWNTARRGPERVAIVERDTSTTYGELLARATAVARELMTLGVAPGDRVAIFLERSADAAAAFYGTLACGGIAIMVNETLRSWQIEHISSHASVKVILTTDEMLKRLPRELEVNGSIKRMEGIGTGDAMEPLPRVSGDYSQIIYTSGSTGLPKGVTWTHANLWAGMRAVSSYVRITADDRLASLLPFSFDYGFNQLLCAVNAGATLVIERSPVPQQIIATLRSARVTVLACVPPLWLQLLTAPDFASPLPALRAMTNTGGRVPVDAVRKLRAYQPHAELFLMYGLTEAFRATYLDPSEVDEHPDSIGRAIPGSEVMVVREDGSLCEPDEIGELVQRGPTVAAGYWNEPELTASVYRPNPQRPKGAPDSERVVYSGDLVRRDTEGRLYYVGRRDRVIKSLGVRVSPDEVASVLHDSGEVSEAIVGAEPDEVRGNAIIAHVVLKEGGSVQRLERFCKTEMPRYMQPMKIHVHEELPRTATGKFDLRAAESAVQGRLAGTSA